MGKIKPTRIVTPRIVQPRSGWRPWVWVVLVVGLAAWSWQVFEFGRVQASLDARMGDPTPTDPFRRIAELEQERDALRASAARLERAGQIDRAAAESVQAEIRALQEERAELKREVAFLKRMVSGGDSKLVLDGQSLTALDELAYRFEVTLSKQTEDEDTINGHAVIRVTGQLNGAEKTLDMQTLTNGKRSNIGIRFKNFQRLTTDLSLPKGFEPAKIEVAVKPDGKSFRSFEQSFDWKPSDA
jgi:hypothetical protein